MFTIFRFLICFFVALAALNASAENLYVLASRRAELWLDKSQNRAQLKAQLPKESVIVAEQGQFFVIEYTHVIQEEDLQILRGIPGVKQVQRGRLVRRQNSEEIACAKETQAELPGIQNLEAIQNRLNKTCSTSVVCTETGRTKLWGQYRVAADLMAKEMLRIGISQTVNVAVIDTGFSSSHTSLMTEKLKVKKGHEQASEPSMDQLGHGTSVASLIGGKNGVGVSLNPNLTVYKEATAASERPSLFGSVSLSDHLKLSILRACEEGNEIINLSFGSAEDEAGIARDEDTDPLLLKHLTERGCLVIKASGNSGIKKIYQRDSLDDAYLRVGATSPFGIADFSSTGEVNAPGEGIFVLTTENRNEKKRNHCGDHGALNNGTSLAAPITSAIATDTLRVLKLSPQFRKLPNPQKIALTNRVIAASSLENSVNGLRSVLIAERWVKKNTATIPTVEELRSSLEKIPAPICGSKPANCSAKEPCDPEFQSCIDNARARMLLCKTNPGEAADMFKAVAKSGSLENASEWLPRLQSLPQSRLSSLHKEMAPFWKDFENSNTDLTTKINFYTNYAQAIKIPSDSTRKSLQQQVLVKFKNLEFSEQQSLLEKLQKLDLIDEAYLLALISDSKENLSAVLSFLEKSKTIIPGVEKILSILLASNDNNDLKSLSRALSLVKMEKKNRLGLYEKLFSHPSFSALDYDIIYSLTNYRENTEDKPPVILAYVKHMQGKKSNIQSWSAILDFLSRKDFPPEDFVAIYREMMRNKYNRERNVWIIRKNPNLPRAQLLKELLESENTDTRTAGDIAEASLYLSQEEKSEFLSFLLTHPKIKGEPVGVLARRSCSDEASKQDCIETMEKVLNSDALNKGSLLQLRYAVLEKKLDITFAAKKFQQLEADEDLSPGSAQYLASILPYYEKIPEKRVEILKSLIMRFPKNREVLIGVATALAQSDMQFSNTEELITAILAYSPKSWDDDLTAYLLKIFADNPSAITGSEEILQKLIARNSLQNASPHNLFPALIGAQIPEEMRRELLDRTFAQTKSQKVELSMGLAQSIIKYGKHFGRRDHYLSQILADTRYTSKQKIWLMRDLLDSKDNALIAAHGNFLTKSIVEIYSSGNSTIDDFYALTQVVASHPYLENWLVWTYTGLLQSEVKQLGNVPLKIAKMVKEKKLPAHLEMEILKLAVHSPSISYRSQEEMIELVKGSYLPKEKRQLLKNELLRSSRLGETLRNRLQAINL